MKITKSQLRQIIMEEIEDSITGRDIPNEEKYPRILIAFEEILDSSLGRDNYNLYQELQKIAEFAARNPK
jgi:hypothetical protein